MAKHHVPENGARNAVPESSMDKVRHMFEAMFNIKIGPEERPWWDHHARKLFAIIDRVKRTQPAESRQEAK